MGRLCYPTQFRPNHQSLFFGRWHLSAGKGGYGALFAVMVQILLRAGAIAVQFVSEPEISQGAGLKLHVDARVRVQQPLQICLGCRSKSKKCDKQLTHIVRVMGQALFICLGTRKLSWYMNFFEFVML